MAIENPPTRHPYPDQGHFLAAQMGDLGTTNLSVSHQEVTTENVKPSSSSSKERRLQPARRLLLSLLGVEDLPRR